VPAPSMALGADLLELGIEDRIRPEAHVHVRFEGSPFVQGKCLVQGPAQRVDRGLALGDRVDPCPGVLERRQVVAALGRCTEATWPYDIVN
jgi:hypothetical protein